MSYFDELDELDEIEDVDQLFEDIGSDEIGSDQLAGVLRNTLREDHGH